MHKLLETQLISTEDGSHSLYVPQLKEQYDKFVNDIIDIINYSGVPDLIINQNKRLKKLYESHYLK